MKNVIKKITKSYDETMELGRKIAPFLVPGDVVALYGDLGSGKTVMAQGICAGLEVTDYVTSPSFILMQTYKGRLPVYHFDFYRLNSASEVEDLDVLDYFDGEGVCIVEWPERGETFLPETTISVQFERVMEKDSIMPDQRKLEITFPENRIKQDDLL